MADDEEWYSSEEEEYDKVGYEEIFPISGIKKKLLKRGAFGGSPFFGDEITVHYVGTLLDGTKFASTRDNNQPLTFILEFHSEQVVKGLIVGLITMKKGEVALFTLPSLYAYGKHGRDGVPSNSIVQCEVELISWVELVDVCKDGGTIKRILEKGSSSYDKKPTELDEAVVKYQIMLPDGTLVAETPKAGVKFDVNSGHLVPAFEKAIQTMEVGEKANLTVKPQYGFDDSKIEAGSMFSALPPYFGDIDGIMLSSIPPNSSLSINLELVSCKRVFYYDDESKMYKKIIKGESQFDRSKPGDLSREKFKSHRNGAPSSSVCSTKMSAAKSPKTLAVSKKRLVVSSNTNTSHKKAKISSSHPGEDGTDAKRQSKASSKKSNHKLEKNKRNKQKKADGEAIVPLVSKHVCPTILGDAVGSLSVACSSASSSSNFGDSPLTDVDKWKSVQQEDNDVSTEDFPSSLQRLSKSEREKLYKCIPDSYLKSLKRSNFGDSMPTDVDKEKNPRLEDNDVDKEDFPFSFHRLSQSERKKLIRDLYKCIPDSFHKSLKGSNKHGHAEKLIIESKFPEYFVSMAAESLVSSLLMDRWVKDLRGRHKKYLKEAKEARKSAMSKCLEMKTLHEISKETLEMKVSMLESDKKSLRLSLNQHHLDKTKLEKEIVELKAKLDAQIETSSNWEAETIRLEQRNVHLLNRSSKYLYEGIDSATAWALEAYSMLNPAAPLGPFERRIEYLKSKCIAAKIGDPPLPLRTLMVMMRSALQRKRRMRRRRKKKKKLTEMKSPTKIPRTHSLVLFYVFSWFLRHAIGYRY